MPSSTSRMGYTYPLGTDPTDVEGAIQLLATQLDSGAPGATAAAGFLSGLADTNTGLPMVAPGVAGRIFYATNTSAIYFDTSMAWINFGVNTPIGGIIAYGGPNNNTLIAPANYLLCDGSPYSQTTYAGLFSIIGTHYGSPGSGQFNVPDLQGRTVIGSGTGMGLSSRGLGNQGGQEAITLSINQMPAHGHGVQDNGHGHLLTGSGGDIYYSGGGGSAYGIDNGKQPNQNGANVNPAGSIASNVTSVSITNTGGSTATPTLPPFTVASWIIRYQ